MEPNATSSTAPRNLDASQEAFKRAAWAYVDFDPKVNIGCNVANALYSNVNAKASNFQFGRTSPQEPRRRIVMRDQDSASVPGNSDSTTSSKSAHVDTGKLFLNKCKGFFTSNGLVAKVRKLPCEGIKSNIGNGTQVYPKYHFISRLRRHMFEHLMRSRTFLDTRYNSCNEMRNSKSPFSLFELNSTTINRLQELLDDLDDPDFSGLYISLSTRAYCTSGEYGTFKRSKVIAWAIVELQASNERCLKCLWVHPNLCATSTTALLSAMLPYVVYVSFDYGPCIFDARYPHKIFYVWLSDFDLFPRQALVLLASMDRFGLVKHYESSAEGSVGGGGGGDVPSGDASREVKAPPEDFEKSRLPPEPPLVPGSPTAEGAITGDHDDHGEHTTSHTDAGIKADACQCMAGADWEQVDQVILACSFQLMQMLLPKWRRLVASGECSHLKRDVETLLLPQGSITRANRFVETYTEIRIAEFTGLEHLQVRDLMMFLYGSKWKYRLKLKTIKGPKSPPPLDYALENCTFNTAGDANASNVQNPTHARDKNATDASVKKSTSFEDYDMSNDVVVDARLERRRRRHMEL